MTFKKAFPDFSVWLVKEVVLFLTSVSGEAYPSNRASTTRKPIRLDTVPAGCDARADAGAKSSGPW
jgi:hypothetical protein